MQLSSLPSSAQQYLTQSVLSGSIGAYGQAYGAGQGSAASAASDPVSLSDAGRALAAQDSGANNGSSGGSTGTGTGVSGSSDFSQEAQFLSGLADKSLAALGVISPSDESGVQVSFDSMSYEIDTSIGASQTQQGGQVTSQLTQEQDETFTGEGKITTADGRTFDFQIQVQMDQAQQFTQQIPDGGVAQSWSPLSTDASGGSTAADPSASSSAADVANASDAASNGVSASGSQTGSGSSGLINWDAILKQSTSLIELLDSLAAAGANTTTSLTGATGAAGSASGTTAASSAAAAASSTAASTAAAATSPALATA